jgi:hypothetical protein
MSFDPKAARLDAAQADEAAATFSPSATLTPEGGDRQAESRMIAASHLKIDLRPSPTE